VLPGTVHCSLSQLDPDHAGQRDQTQCITI